MPTFWNGSQDDRAALYDGARYARTAMNLKAGVTAVAAAAVVLGLTACGSSSKAPGVMLAPGGGATVEAVTTTSTTSTTSTTATTPTTGALSHEPTITLQKGPAPKKLVVKDVIVGTGATAEKGDTLDVNYVGALFSNAKVFDSSWKDTPGKSFAFTLGNGSVIKGWDTGLEGMKVGGRRELIIPSSLGYGKSGSGSTIPPNAALIFIVDLLKVTK